MTAGFRILPMPQRPSRELVAALAEMVTAHLSDNMNRLQGAAAASSQAPLSPCGCLRATT